jgi:hypothetical protein
MSRSPTRLRAAAHVQACSQRPALRARPAGLRSPEWWILLEPLPPSLTWARRGEPAGGG